MKQLALAMLAAAGLSACELTPEEQAAILQGIANGLNEAAYDTQFYGSDPYYGGSGYGSGYGSSPRYGGVRAQTLQLCVSSGGRGYVTTAQIRSGNALNLAVGGNVYRNDRNYVSVPTSSGIALISIPTWASFAEGPVYGTDQQGIRWRLSLPSRCY